MNSRTRQTTTAGMRLALASLGMAAAVISDIIPRTADSSAATRTDPVSAALTLVALVRASVLHDADLQ
jgi:hypothetical protein